MNTIRANVYTLVGESLGASQKEAINDGLDIVGQYIGGISVVKTAGVRLPQDQNGVVQTSRVGYRALDRQADLHLFVAPLDRSKGQLGASYYASGVAYVGSNLALPTTKTTTAHEVAHAFGYVLSDSPQHDRASLGHCTAECCVMQPTAAAIDEETIKERDAFKAFSDSLGFTAIDYKLTDPNDDFCLPCKADMRDTYEAHVAQLRMDRALTGTIRPTQQIISNYGS